ncbi:hypothetical protein NXX73_06195 [Bacteroides fragilis]|nr:hypothetical protein [Bacteroides fragilis]
MKNSKVFLKKNGVQDSDIQELQEILIEEPELIDNKFGSKVNAWLKNMLNKAVDGSWQISIGAAGTLLAEALEILRSINE